MAALARNATWASAISGHERTQCTAHESPVCHHNQDAGWSNATSDRLRTDPPFWLCCALALHGIATPVLRAASGAKAAQSPRSAGRLALLSAATAAGAEND